MKRILLLALAVSFSSLSFAGSTIKVTMDARKPNGKPWDIMNGAPDPYVKVDGVSYKGQRCQNSHSCSFSISKTITEPVSIEVWDADVQFDDPAGSTFCIPMQQCETRSSKIIIY